MTETTAQRIGWGLSALFAVFMLVPRWCRN